MDRVPVPPKVVDFASNVEAPERFGNHLVLESPENVYDPHLVWPHQPES